MTDIIKMTGYTVTREEAEKIAKTIGWTPPNKTTWTPKEGELFLLSIGVKGKWAASTYDPIRHQNVRPQDMRPHPTHLCWETGPRPENTQLAFCYTLNKHGNVYIYGDSKGEIVIEREDKRWARLPMEVE